MGINAEIANTIAAQKLGFDSGKSEHLCDLIGHFHVIEGIGNVGRSKKGLTRDALRLKRREGGGRRERGGRRHSELAIQKAGIKDESSLVILFRNREYP